jgi:hypothetical protein
VVKQAGYDKMEWQGKWHSGNTLQDYGFTAWDPQDAGRHVPGLGGSFCDILLVGAYMCEHASLFPSIQSQMFYMLKLDRNKSLKPATTQRKTQEWQ